MTRTLRQHADDDILDRAAGLFARRGYSKTSVQEIADAVGLSKAGLLHHFPTKDALHQAVADQAGMLADQVTTAAQSVPAGPDRDRFLIGHLVDVALAHPGLVALLLSPSADDAGTTGVESAGDAALHAFGLDGTDGPDVGRTVRVLGALASLALLTLEAIQLDAMTAWRPHIVATCLSALADPTSPEN